MNYNQYGQLTSVELTDFYSVDFSTNKPCTCLTKEQMVQLCFEHFFAWEAEKHGRKVYGEIATTYLQPCWHVDYKVLKVKKGTIGLSQEDVKNAQKYLGQPDGGSAKQNETILSNDEVEIVLDYHSPCDNQEVCCYAIQKVDYHLNQDETITASLHTIKPPTYTPECKSNLYYPEGACSSMCNALIFDASSKRINNNTEGHTDEALYPNPNNGIFKLIVDQRDDYTKLEIFDNLGNLVHSMNLSQDISEYDIIVTDLPSGIYQYRLISTSKSEIQGKITIIK